MKTIFFKILTRDNTAPFLLVSILYCFVLATPFLYFTYLKSQVHVSYSVNMESLKEESIKDTINKTKINIQGGNEVPLNKFDTATDNYSTPNDENGSDYVFIKTNNVSDWKKDADSRGFIMLTKIAIFSIIFAFGALGAAVSLITRIRNNEATLNNITTYEILSVQTIGGIFAFILGFAFMGNMIAGTLFPNPIVFTRIIYVIPAFAKLVVWSFIAGFSERFVPNLLNNFSKKVENENS
jgi:hypothetical protein